MEVAPKPFEADIQDNADKGDAKVGLTLEGDVVVEPRTAKKYSLTAALFSSLQEAGDCWCLN